MSAPSAPDLVGFAPGSSSPRFDVVVPTVGRDSLEQLLAALAVANGPLPGRVLLVDDRRDRSSPVLPGGPPAPLADRLQLVAGLAGRAGGRPQPRLAAGQGALGRLPRR